jgi:L-iditol 2-dehydrogenase
MKAAVLYGREEIRVESLEEGVLLAGEVRVRIGAALTCGTDLKVYRRGYHARMLTPPCVFGHELAGTIVEVAPGAVGWFVGDRVVCANSAPCGHCGRCAEGQENLCDDLRERLKHIPSIFNEEDFLSDVISLSYSLKNSLHVTCNVVYPLSPS